MEKNQFIKEYSNQLKEEQASLFVGAGMSMDNGFMDWKGLIKKLTEPLNLDIEKENNFPEIAEYFVQYWGGRNKLLELIKQNFYIPVKKNKNHKYIAELPIKSIWTTNFDCLIEERHWASETVVLD